MTSDMTTPQVIGFWRGFVVLFAAARRLAGLPRAWPFMVVPAFVCLLLEGAFIGLSWRFLKPWASVRLATVSGFRTRWPSRVMAGGRPGGVARWRSRCFGARAQRTALERVVGITESTCGTAARGFGILHRVLVRSARLVDQPRHNAAAGARLVFAGAAAPPLSM